MRVERSRSGNGAHVWFFFTAPVAASAARKMGCYLITETMARRHELSMESYDRLFPNQDTMPRGGFGNLIALPLQHGPRQQGNTVFLDERARAVSDDQLGLPRVGRAHRLRGRSRTLSNDAAHAGSVVGVRIGDTDADDEADPVDASVPRAPDAPAIT